MADDCKKSKRKSCPAYRTAGRREINKVKRLARYLAKRPDDRFARAALSAIHLTHVGIAKREMKAAGSVHALAALT